MHLISYILRLGTLRDVHPRPKTLQKLIACPSLLRSVLILLYLGRINLPKQIWASGKRSSGSGPSDWRIFIGLCERPPTGTRTLPYKNTEEKQSEAIIITFLKCPYDVVDAKVTHMFKLKLTQKFLLILFREVKENSPEVLDKLIRGRTVFIGSRLKMKQKNS